MSGWIWRLLTSLVIAGYMAASGRRKRSLSGGGAVAAVAIGVAHLSCGVTYGLVLILFYYTSSRLTRWRGALKAKLEAGHVEGGERTAAQVLVNSLAGALLAIAATWERSRAAGGGPSCLGGGTPAGVLDAAFLGFAACCTGDTWSSEVGIVSRAPPRLITSWRVVPPGTNGGVSLLGTAAAAAGGLTIGACWLLLSLATRPQCGGAEWVAIPLALGSALLGSLLDSLLGACLQFSGVDEASGKAVSRPAVPGSGRSVHHVSGIDMLSNNAVNCLASLATAGAAAAAAAWLL